MRLWTDVYKKLATLLDDSEHVYKVKPMNMTFERKNKKKKGNVQHFQISKCFGEDCSFLYTRYRNATVQAMNVHGFPILKNNQNSAGKAFCKSAQVKK